MPGTDRVAGASPAPAAAESARENISPRRGADNASEPSTDGRATSDGPHEPRMERRQKKDYFPFMELPSELRLEIYRMALSRPKPILLHMPRPSEKETQKQESPYLWDADSDPDPTDNGQFENQVVHQAMQQQARRAIQARRAELKKKQLPTGAHGINTDPLVPALLRVSQLIYREARPVLYSDNELVLHLPSALCTLSQLHQRSRSLIKHVRLAIPTHHDILEGFADLVRLGLRYCWGLKTFTISLPDMFPEERHVPSSTTNVYANAFHILRWLPKNTVVRLEGNVHEEIRKVVEENGRLSGLLSEVGFPNFKFSGLVALTESYRRSTYVDSTKCRTAGKAWNS